MLQTRMPNPNDVYSLRSSRADRYPVPMDAMDDSDVRHASNKRSQSVGDKLSDKTMRCWCTSVPLVWSTASAQGALQSRSCKVGDGALASLTAGCSGVLASFFEEFIFSIFGTRLRADHRSPLRASTRVTDIASALADGSEHSLFGQTRIFDMIDSGCMVTTVDLERQLSLLDLGLTKAHRSCVDGDGAVSVRTVFTPEMKFELPKKLFDDLLVSADFAPTVDYQITDTQLSALQTMKAPYHLKSASPGTPTPTKLTVVLALGHQCLLCIMVSPGDDSTRNVVEHACPHCGENTAATRAWLARAANPLIVRTQLNLMVYEHRDANVVKKLNFSALADESEQSFLWSLSREQLDILQQSLWEADQWVSHLNRGLAKAHSSAVDGDGATSNAMWTQWTTALSDQITLDLSVHLLAADQMTVAYGVTPDKIKTTVQNGQLPLCVTTTSPWNQQTPDKKEILLLLGCQCPNCGALLPGDVNNNTEPEAVCAQCGEMVILVRTWIAKSNHPLIRAAQQQMDMQSRLDTLVVKKLSFADVSPVKGGSSEKHGRLLAESIIGTVVVCQCGAVQAPLTTVARQCTVCQHWLQFGSVEITVRPDLILDPAVRQSLNFRNPTLLQLILANMTLTLDQQAAQEQSKLISQFPQYPLAIADQVTAARGSGLLMTSATPPIKFFKPMLDALLGLTTRIGTGSGDFEVLNYLTNKSATSRQERFRQQKGLVACLRQGKLLDLWEAILSGKLILVEDEKENKGGTSAMATKAVSILVRSLLEAPGQFGKCRTTELHEVLAERACRGTSSVLVIDPRILEQLDEALFKLLRKFVPTSFFQGLEDKFWDLKQCRVSSISFLMLILGEDKHSEAIEAKDTRQDLDSVLSTAWKHAETAVEFRRRYEENLAKYHAFSSIPRYPAGLEGQREQIEHLLTLFKKGALKTVVMNKWENLKLKAELAQSPEPDLENFWRTVKFQYSIIEAKDAREVASRAPPSEDKSKGKRTMDESINSIGLDARPCFQFTNSGTCKRGADCPFAHDPAFKKTEGFRHT